MKMEVDLELSVGGSFRNLENLENCSCSRSEDAKAKREIQALRRQAAKRKREEKRKGMKNGGGDDERMRLDLEAKRLQCRAKDRERRENDESDLTHHKSNIDHRNHGIVEGSIQMMVPIHYAYPPRVQYVPLAFPYMVPCWAPATGIQPVKPVPARPGCGGGGGGRSVLSEGWTNSSPSVSPQDGWSSDPQNSSSSDGQGESDERSVSSYQKESSSQGTSSEKSTSCDEKVSSSDRDGTSRLNSSSIDESISSPLKKAAGERKSESSEQPKPGHRNQNQNQNQNPPSPPNSLEQMPCVSTTGNGPNGKTITGLLYRYTKTEIRIVCVCHGNSFSPAGFVEHAGGVDVSQPLRHITVIPSAFA